MRFFPNPEDLSPQELQDLYRIRRFSEWETVLKVIGRSRGQIIADMETQAVKPDRDVVLVDIGALAFTGELQEFIEACEETLNQIKR